MAIVTSKQYSLNTRDLLKGLLVAVIAATIKVIYISAKAHTFDWAGILDTAVEAGLAYLSKNFFTPAQTVITAADTVDPVPVQNPLPTADTGPGSIPTPPPPPPPVTNPLTP
jgi:hypothetical protein